jgi:hypothetical protein
VGDANHFTNAQRFALPTVIQMTALRAFLPSVSHLYILTQSLLIQINSPIGITKIRIICIKKKSRLPISGVAGFFTDRKIDSIEKFYEIMVIRCLSNDSSIVVSVFCPL